MRLSTPVCVVLFAVASATGLPVWAQADEAVAVLAANESTPAAPLAAAPIRYVLPPPSNKPVAGFGASADIAPAISTASATANTSLVDRARNNAAEMVYTAMNFLGVRYRWGGESAESGFDCSGFTRQVFERSIGLLLPRRAEEQARAPGLMKVVWADLKPGDLVFFNTLRRTFSHVGIYVGDGKFIHAPHTGANVRVDNLTNHYWARRFTGGRRAEQAVQDDASLSARSEAQVADTAPTAN